MSISILTTEPASIISGDSAKWQITLADYPATSGWVLKYALVCAAGVISIASTPSGADHLIDIKPSVSSIWKAGIYQVQKYVESGSGETLQRTTLGTGSIEIITGAAAATAATDTRTQNRRILDAINLAIEGRASRTDLEYTINTGSISRTIKSMTVEQLLKAQSTYTLMVWRELNPGKLCPQIRLNIGGYRG